MSPAWQRLVPEHLHDAVLAGLIAVFDGADVDAVEPVTGGVSGATALRVQRGPRARLLRVEAVRKPYRNPHQYAGMCIAAEAGVAPPLHYMDAEAGVAIMDFIVTRPLATYPGGTLELVRALGKLAARLQATPPFPSFLDYRNVIRLLTERLQGRFAPGLLDAHREQLERICATLPWDAATHVSSHNDPNPRNILFDGERLWLVDWETAYRNDPFVDLAILADNLAVAPALEEALLEAWLGRSPDAQQLQRLCVVRALSRLYYGGLLGMLVEPDSPKISDLAALSREEFGRRIASGALQATSAATRIALMKMSLAGFLELAQVPGG